MKRNIIFVLLTAAILALGFYSTDIYERLRGDSFAGMNVIRRSGDENGAVYLSEEKNIIDPMSLVRASGGKQLSDEDDLIKDAATSMVKAMARLYDKTYITRGTNGQLDDAWRANGKGFIYAENWQYVNSAGEQRCLDCIMSKEDLSIVYIRFYSDETVQLTAQEMNEGLDRLDAYSEEYYPHTAGIAFDIESMLTSYYEAIYGNHYGDIDVPVDVMKYDILFEPVYYERYSEIIMNGFSEVKSIIRRYELMQELTEVYCSPENPLPEYWLSQAAFLTIEFTEGSFAAAGYKVTDQFLQQDGTWLKPSYTADKGVIYQTIGIGGNELTVIYNVRDDLIEGFFFPDTDNAAVEYYPPIMIFEYDEAERTVD